MLFLRIRPIITATPALSLSPMLSSMNAEVLKTRPDILATVSDHLYGQLEGYVCTSSDPRLARQWEAHECDVEERETLLGEFLCFLNTLSATHVAIRSVLASDVWFGTLLRIVDINTATGGWVDGRDKVSNTPCDYITRTICMYRIPNRVRLHCECQALYITTQ